MKSIITILSILIVASCSNPTDPESTHNPEVSFTESINAVSNTSADTSSTSGERTYTDSAHFHIIRGKYVSGNRFIEVYQNTQTKLDHWKEFYENGQLKQEGMMTSVHNNYVGEWKYFSHTGQLDSVVDYDKKYPVSYFAALKIAEKNGFKMPDIEVTLQVDNLNTYWQIARWKENENHGGQTADAIHIDTKTGKVTKPKGELLGID